MIQDGLIHGGETMDFNLLGYDDELLSEISRELDKVVRSGYWSGGKYVKEIEKKFDTLYKMHSVACASGGMALELIANVFPNIKKIGCQSNTYFASLLPWINREKEIILIGTEKQSLSPSLEFVKEASKFGVDAIILTHIGGYPIPEIKKIADFCKFNKILLIEDCAHSPLTKIDDKYVGSFGDASIFSFFPTKPIPAGEGGIVLFKNKNISNKASIIRDYGKVNLNNKIFHKLPAVSNGRLNEFSASVVYTFLNNYKKIQIKRKKLADIYDNLIPAKFLYQKNFKNKQVLSYYKYITFVKKSKHRVSSVYDKENQLYSILKDNEIQFEFVGENPLGVHHICLPLFPNMQKVDIEKVVEGCVF